MYLDENMPDVGLEEKILLLSVSATEYPYDD